MVEETYFRMPNIPSPTNTGTAPIFNKSINYNKRKDSFSNSKVTFDSYKNFFNFFLVFVDFFSCFVYNNNNITLVKAFHLCYLRAS